MVKVKFSGIDCIVKKSFYANNDNLALVLLDSEDTSEVVAYVTVNINDKFPEDTGLVKDYSENTGMLKAIQNAGLVKEVHGNVDLGETSAPIVTFNLEGVGVL